MRYQHKNKLSSKIFIYSSLFLLSILSTACNDNSGARRHAIANNPPIARPKPKPIVFDRYWNDVARYLGGMEPLPGSKLDSLEKRPEALEYRRFLDKEWRVKDSVLLRKFRRWSEKELADVRNLERNVFYPFSGPDFLHVHTLLPKAKLYVFLGLEDEGDPQALMNLSPARMPANLNTLKAALDDVMKLSFFVTRDMSNKFRASDLRGCLPLMLLFLARTGNEVVDVDRIKITPQGTADTLVAGENIKQSTQDNIVTGVEITFRGGPDAPLQKVQYYSFDAQDIMLNKHENDLMKYFSSLQPATTYVKSASYLMHWGTYSKMRNKTLEVSDIIIQDDTGIALRYFDKNAWNIKIYGVYTPPTIQVFRAQYQRDLDQLYKSDTSVKKLDFALGYKSPYGEANLLVARKKR